MEVEAHYHNALPATTEHHDEPPEKGTLVDAIRVADPLARVTGPTNFKGFLQYTHLLIY